MTRAGDAAALLGAEDAGGDALLQAKRTAQRPHEVADFQLVAVAPLGGDQVAHLGLEHGDVGQRVDAHDARRAAAAVAQLDFRRFDARR